MCCSTHETRSDTKLMETRDVNIEFVASGHQGTACSSTSFTHGTVGGCHDQGVGDMHTFKSTLIQIQSK